MISPWTSGAELAEALKTPREDTTAARAFVSYEIAEATKRKASERLLEARKELAAAEKALQDAVLALGLTREKIRDVLGFIEERVHLSSGDRR